MKLANIGLKMMENIKMNPRIIVHSVPTEMTLEEIKTEVIAQNLEGIADSDLKVTYIYRSKEDYELCLGDIACNSKESNEEWSYLFPLCCM